MTDSRNTGVEFEGSYQIAPTVGWRELGERVVVADVRTGAYCVFVEVEALVWRKLVEGATLGDISDEVLDNYDVSSDLARTDVLSFVSALEDEQLIISTES